MVTDIRYAARLLVRAPLFTSLCVLSLAIGTGATTSMFQLLNAVSLRALPVAAPDEIVEIRLVDRTHARGAWLRDDGLTNPLWEQLRLHHDGLSTVFAWADEAIDASTSGDARKSTMLWVSGEFFDALRVRPALGRLFTPADDRRGCGREAGVVLNDAYWQREFGGDRSIVGRSISIGAMHARVVGVTPPTFFGLEVGRTFDIAAPICAEPAWHGIDARLRAGTVWWLTVMGRVPPGGSIAQVSDRLAGQSPAIFAATLPAGYPAASVTPYLNMRLVAAPAARGVSHLRVAYARPLVVLLTITAVVLLIACVNVAQLMLLRAAGRERELALRASLGASPRDLARHVVAEIALLAAAGTVVGALAAAAATTRVVALVASASTGVFLDLSIDWRLLGFAALLTTTNAAIFGSLPLRQAWATNAVVALDAGGHGGTANREQRRVRRVLLASQVALSFALLIASVVFVRSLRNLSAVDAGFDPHAALVADLDFDGNGARGGVRSAAANVAFRQTLVERIRALPTVSGAAEALYLPVVGGNWNNRVWMDGSDPREARVVMRNMIGPEYFRTLRTPIVAGREFDEPDLAATAAKVAVVNERFTDAFGIRGSAVGRRLWIEPTPQEPRVSYEIVGVAANAKYHDLREDDPPELYVPMWPAALRRASGTFVVRARTGTKATADELRTALGTFGTVRYAFRDYEAVVRNSLLRERLMATLAAPFGIVAVLLTAIGLYGVFSYAVARRTREIGIRIALGADRRAVMQPVFREAAAITGTGLLAGAALVAAGRRVLDALLFGLRADDPISIALAAAAIAAVAFVATYLPAQRAVAIDPAAALRHD